MDIRKVITGIGMVLIVPGLMALLSIPVCLIFKEYNEIWGFVLTAVPSLAIGTISFYLRPSTCYRVFEMVVIISVSWFLVTLCGTIPFIYQGLYYANDPSIPEDITFFTSFVNALFESVSGFTSTGLTMVKREAMLTYSTQWWRTFMQWIGGIGIIVIITFFHNPRLYTMDQYHEKEDFANVIPNPNVNIKNHWWIYLMFTVFGIALLMIKKMPIWEAVNHGMTGIATGGFTITSNSYIGYSDGIKISTVFIMILGSLSFSLFYKLIKQGQLKAFFINTQVIVFFALLAGGILSIGLLNRNSDIPFVDTVFQVVSALATCGFQSNDVHYWTIVPVLLLSMAMLIGGTTDSTTGGIRIFRFWIFFKSIFINSSRVLFHPSKPLKVHLQNEKLNVPERNKDLLMDTYIYLLLWLFVYIVGTILLAHILQHQYELKDIIFEASSAFGNAGMSTGITNADMVLSAKILMIVIMIAGRLEMMPLMIFFGLLFRRKEE